MSIESERIAKQILWRRFCEKFDPKQVCNNLVQSGDFSKAQVNYDVKFGCLRAVEIVAVDPNPIDNIKIEIMLKKDKVNE